MFEPNLTEDAIRCLPSLVFGSIKRVQPLYNSNFYAISPRKNDTALEAICATRAAAKD